MHEGSQLELLAEVDPPGGWVVLRQFLQWGEISADQHEDALRKKLLIHQSLKNEILLD